MDQEKPMELAGEHCQLHDLWNSHSDDSLHRDREWAEYAEEMIQTREFNTFYL
jgi:hypothetical protein